MKPPTQQERCLCPDSVVEYLEALEQDARESGVVIDKQDAELAQLRDQLDAAKNRYHYNLLRLSDIASKRAKKAERKLSEARGVARSLWRMETLEGVPDWLTKPEEE